MELEYQLSNGNWTAFPPAKLDTYLAYAAEHEAHIAAHRGTPARTPATLKIALSNGETIQYDPDWYAKLRQVRTPEPVPSVPTTTADCGHQVAQGLVMTTSRGTSCSECYDAMSD